MIKSKANPEYGHNYDIFVKIPYTCNCGNNFQMMASGHGTIYGPKEMPLIIHIMV